MSSRQFTKLAPALWRSARFLNLADRTAQILHVYYLSSEHQTSAGAFRLPDGYAMHDLDMPKVEYVEMRAKLIEAGLILYDPATCEFYVPRWFKHCPANNDKHAMSIRRRISELECDAIREVAEQEFEDAESIRSSAKVVPIHGGIANSRLVTGAR